MGVGTAGSCTMQFDRCRLVSGASSLRYCGVLIRDMAASAHLGSVSCVSLQCEPH